MKIVLLVISGLLLMPTTAQAGWRAERAQAIARIVWHDPCGGAAQLRWAAIAAARVAEAKDCTVTVQTDREPWGWDEFCSMMIHEYGHLAGMSHSDNPFSVMQSNDGQEGYFVDPRCAHRGRPYLERHGILKPRHCARRRLRCADGPGSQPEPGFR